MPPPVRPDFTTTPCSIKLFIDQNDVGFTSYDINVTAVHNDSFYENVSALVIWCKLTLIYWLKKLLITGQKVFELVYMIWCGFICCCFCLDTTDGF